MVLCLAAAVAVHAYPAEAEIEIQQAVEPVEEVEDDPSNVEGDLEGSESRWGGGRSYYGGGFGFGGGYGYGGGKCLEIFIECKNIYFQQFFPGYGGYGGGEFQGFKLLKNPSNFKL